jgi:hypothetical protein
LVGDIGSLCLLEGEIGTGIGTIGAIGAGAGVVTDRPLKGSLTPPGGGGETCEAVGIVVGITLVTRVGVTLVIMAGRFSVRAWSLPFAMV